MIEELKHIRKLEAEADLIKIP